MLGGVTIRPAVVCYILMFLLAGQRNQSGSSRAQSHAHESLERRLHEADALLQQGKLEEAERTLKDLVALQPGTTASAELVSYRAAAYRSLGSVYLRLNKTSAAISALQDSLRLNPDQPGVHYEVGVLLLGNRQFAPASLHLEKSRSLGLDNVAVLLNLARAHFALGRPSQALERIDQILARNPRGGQTHYEIGLLLFENLFYSRALQSLQSARETNPASYEINLYLALVNFLLEKFEPARELLEELSGKGIATPDLYNLLGSVYAKLGKFDEATTTLQKGIRRDPARADSYVNLALVYLEMGRDPQAEEMLERARQTAAAGASKVFYIVTQNFCAGFQVDGPETERNLNPGKAEYYLNLAALFQNRYHHTTALALLRLAAKYQRASARLLYAVALSCFNLEPFTPRAAEIFRKVTEIEPGMDRAHYLLGEAYSRLGNASEALEAYKKAIEISPRTALYHHGAGRTLAAAGWIQEAMRMLESAIELNPEYAPSYYELGKLYLQLGDAQRAAQNLEKAVSLDPEFYEPYYSLGRAHAKMQDAEKAKRAFALFESRKRIASERATSKGGFTRANE